MRRPLACLHQRGSELPPQSATGDYPPGHSSGVLGTNGSLTHKLSTWWSWAAQTMERSAECERWRGFQWGDLSKTERRGFRNHWPIYTQQTLWDQSDYLSQSCADVGRCDPTLDNEPCTQVVPGSVRPNSLVFTDDLDTWMRESHPRVPAHVKYSLLVYEGDRNMCPARPLALLAMHGQCKTAAPPPPSPPPSPPSTESGFRALPQL